MKRIIALAAALALAIGVANVTAGSSFSGYSSECGYSALYQGLPVQLQQPELPSIPEGSVSVTDFGAVGDGITDCTGAFASAIDALVKKGGGHLIVPAGVWITGPIELKSKIDLHLESGALVRFSNDKKAFMPAPDKWKGKCLPCLRAEKCTDVSITGSGILDGNGKYWRYVKKDKVSPQEWKDYKALGGVESQDGKYWFPYNLKGVDNITDSPENEEKARPHMISFTRCSRVLIQGVTVQNSPKFHIVPGVCTDVILDGVDVHCPWNAQNGDGIDITNSRKVLVTGCRVDVGDDGICMKGSTGENGLKKGPCEDVLITGCTVLRAHGGFVIGSDMSGGMNKIVVQDCAYSGTETGLRFKSAPGRGGKCSDIFIRRITMSDIRNEAVTFTCDYEDITYQNNSQGGQNEFLPDFTGIDISDVVCSGCRTAVEASGIKGVNCVHGISIHGCTFFVTGKEPLKIDASTSSVELKDNVVKQRGK